MTSSTGGQPIDRGRVEAIFPLSPMQESLLFNSLRCGASDPGLLQLVCTLQGALQPALFEQAWVRVLERHAALRTSLHWLEVEKPLQVVMRRVGVRVHIEDWRDVPDAVRGERMASLLESDRVRGLDLSRSPVMRLTLLRMGEEMWTLVWTCHHALLDGWSGALVLGEVSAEYEASHRGEEPALLPARPYREYIAWLLRQDPGEAEAFWKRVFDGMAGPTPLPFDRAGGPLSEAVESVAISIELSVESTAALQEYARHKRITIGTVVQGAWALVLGSECADRDVCFGMTVAGRSAPVDGIERMVGLFINVLPVRVPIAPELPVERFLEVLQQRLSTLLRHEHVAPTQLQAWSSVPGNRRLFESLVLFENFPTEGFDARPERRLQFHDLRGGITTTYPLTLVGLPGERLTLSLHFDRRRFAKSDAYRILDRLRVVIERMVLEPSLTVGDLLALGSRGSSEPAVEVEAPLAVPRSTRAERGGYVAPRSTIESQLVRIWENVLSVREIGVHDDFFELGGHSLTAARLFAEIERILGKRLPLATLFEAPTIEMLARRMQDAGWTPPWSSLVAMQPHGTRPPLFCIHSYEGHLLFFHDLAHCLAPEQPLYGLQAIGLDGKEPPLARVQEMADHYIREIRTIQPTGPYFLLGMCFGVSVALEMGQRLRSEGEDRVELIMLDSGLWTHVPRGRRARRTPVQQVQKVRDEVGRRVRIAVGKVLASTERKRELHFAEVIEQAWWAYRATPFVGRITLIRSEEFAADPGKDWHVTSWSALGTGGFRTYTVPGRHEGLLRGPHVHQLADCLRDCVEGESATVVRRSLRT